MFGLLECLESKDSLLSARESVERRGSTDVEEDRPMTFSFVLRIMRSLESEEILLAWVLVNPGSIDCDLGRSSTGELGSNGYCDPPPMGVITKSCSRPGS